MISELLATYPDSSLKFEPRLIERVGHWQIVGPSVCDGLISMSRNYFADQWVLEQMVKNGVKDLKTEVAKFNSTQEAIFGYIHKASGRYFNFVANDFRDLEDYNTALQVYELAVAGKDDVKVYVNISDTYYKLGDKIKAKASFLKTQQLLEEQKEDVSENYYKNVGDWSKEFDKTNKAYFDELQDVLGDEMESYSNLFISREEMEKNILEIKEKLAELD